MFGWVLVCGILLLLLVCSLQRCGVPTGLRIGQRVLLSDVRLELDELLGHLVAVALRQDTQNGPARLVHLNAPGQGQPARTGALRMG